MRICKRSSAAARSSADGPHTPSTAGLSSRTATWSSHDAGSSSATSRPPPCHTQRARERETRCA
eukprot:6268771-Prymnesium_polylepis.1